jgi:hypothetical protein
LESVVLIELDFNHDADMFYMDVKVCGQNQRAFGIMGWDLSPRIGKELARKAKMIRSTATGNLTSSLKLYMQCICVAVLTCLITIYVHYRSACVFFRFLLLHICLIHLMPKVDVLLHSVALELRPPQCIYWLWEIETTTS